MNRNLIQAALSGDVDLLYKELSNNPTVLHAVALQGGETPLHIACYAGHVNFAVTLIKLRHEISWELNQDGFTPLHIAAACGHAEIVKELLKFDRRLCLIEGKDGKIPLHLAVVKGKLEVVRELLLASVDSVKCKTAQHETSLHLAVKNNQFKALEELIKHLKKANKEDLLNIKDTHGNTILHHAVSKKQHQVVDFLLNGQVTSMEKMELNSLNNRGLTPLDMLLMFQSEAGDREIEEILIQAGAQKSENLQSPTHTHQERPSDRDTRHENPKPREWSEFSHFFRYKETKDSPSEVRNTLRVILILITTATYQLAVSPPGGVWQEDSSASTGNNTSSSTIQVSGKSIMGTKNPLGYILLMCANSFAFFTSCHLIDILTSNFPMRLELLIAMYGMFFCYGICLGTTAPYGYMGIFFTIMWVPLGLMVHYGPMLWRKGEGQGQGPYIFD